MCKTGHLWENSRKGQMFVQNGRMLILNFFVIFSLTENDLTPLKDHYSIDKEYHTIAPETSQNFSS